MKRLAVPSLLPCHVFWWAKILRTTTFINWTRHTTRISLKWYSLRIPLVRSFPFRQFLHKDSSYRKETPGGMLSNHYNLIIFNIWLISCITVWPSHYRLCLTLKNDTTILTLKCLYKQSLLNSCMVRLLCSEKKKINLQFNRNKWDRYWLMYIFMTTAILFTSRHPAVQTSDFPSVA